MLALQSVTFTLLAQASTDVRSDEINASSIPSRSRQASHLQLVGLLLHGVHLAATLHCRDRNEASFVQEGSRNVEIRRVSVIVPFYPSRAREELPRHHSA